LGGCGADDDGHVVCDVLAVSLRFGVGASSTCFVPGGVQSRSRADGAPGFVVCGPLRTFVRTAVLEVDTSSTTRAARIKQRLKPGASLRAIKETYPMSKNDINFIVGNPARRSLTAAPKGGVSIVPTFAAETGKTFKIAKSASARAELSGFKGDAGQTLVVPARTAAGGTTMQLGLGKRSAFDLDAWRKSLIGAAKSVRALKTEAVSITMPDNMTGKKALFGSASLFEIGVATAETIAMVLYRANHYKTAEGGHKEDPRIKDILVNAPGLNADEYKELLSGINAGAYIGSSVAMARDTANEPANICTPTFMAEQAKRVAAESGGTIITTVLEREDCEKLGMGCFLAVAKGSDEPAKFIIMDYAPMQCRADGPVLALVGKSVTFDTGGVDIKPADGMRDMKYDMCGGADVIAAMRAIARLGLPIRVKAYCAATENATGGSAYRPGDVYTAMDGRTVEIDNTDAEGRLTLIDAIAYARTVDKVTHIVDYATLTGAMLVALGDQVAGVFANNQAFADRYIAAAKSVGEMAFQMPTFDVFKDQNKSSIADIKNTGGRLAGSITAGLFVLAAAKDVPAIHVDIAGTSFRSREVGAEPAGGTGWGVRTLVALAADLAKNG